MNINPLRKYPDGTYGSLGPIRFEVSKTEPYSLFPIRLTFCACNDSQVRSYPMIINTNPLEMRQLAGHLLAVADAIEKQVEGGRDD